MDKGSQPVQKLFITFSILFTGIFQEDTFIFETSIFMYKKNKKINKAIKIVLSKKQPLYRATFAIHSKKKNSFKNIEMQLRYHYKLLS